MDSNRFPLQNAIKKILDNPTTRPVLPVLKDSSSTGDGSSVGDKNFGEVAVYDTGTSPSVALNNENVVVEVHKNAKSDGLYYHVGKVAGKKITFGGSQKYDTGVQPSVAITDDGLVVEVHKSENFNTLYYHIGRVNGDKITFGGSYKYDDGVQPSIAITNDGLVVEVHKSQSHDTLWYHIGRVEGDKKITFGTSQKYDDGLYPSVAITDDGLVVEVHQSKDSDNFGKIHYHIGRVAGDKINWEKSFEYDSGSRPSVAITNDGVVVEVHQSEIYETVWYRGTGKVNGNTITWNNEKSQQYSKGREPRVSCNGELAVATHTDGEKLFSSVLTLPAFRSNWINLSGDNSYCYCACNSATNDKQRHASSHTMNIKAGAPYLYAVLTKDDDSIDFPTGAILTIEGPDGTKYDHNIQEKNLLVIMSGSSVRCLIVKNPKPGNWKMTMTVPEGVKFHCECNTVPSKDPYKTITTTLSKTNQLQKRDSSNNGKTDYLGWYALAAVWHLVRNVVTDIVTDALAAAGAGATLGGAVAEGPGALVGGVFGGAIGAGEGAIRGIIQTLQQSPPQTTPTATNMANLSQTFSSSSATPTPTQRRPGGMIRIATWNVYHGNLPADVDPDYQQPRLRQLADRVNELVNYGTQNNIGLIAFQEMPQSILNNPNHPIFINIAANNYRYVIVNSEYPPRPNINAPAPASATTDGYLILYNPTVFTLQNFAPNIQWQYFQPQLFLQGLAQARPPVQLRFQITATGTLFNFLTWHTEPQRALARTYVQNAYNRLIQQGGNWIIAGDLNIDDNNLPQGIVNPHHLTHDGQTLDHIITTGTVISPHPNPPNANSIRGQNGILVNPIRVNNTQWGRFWSDAHYVLFGIVWF